MMNKALHPRDDVDRLYVLRKKRGIGLARIQDSINGLIKQLEDNIKTCGERLITATRNNVDNKNINRTKITRKQK